MLSGRRRPGTPADRTSGTVHVIDDAEEVRWALRVALTSAGIPAETHDSGLAFLERLPELGRIGCVLTDLRMPVLTGLELLERLDQLGFARPVVVMTMSGDVPTAVQVMKAGAFDFIEKPFEDETLLRTVHAALTAPDRAAEARARGWARHRAPEAVGRMTALSPREREVLDLAVQGKTSREIGQELGLSPRTVEVHRARLMARLGVGSFAEAVRLAVLASLATPDQPE